MHFFDRTQKTYGASADLLADRAAFGEHRTLAALELVATQHVDRRARLHGFRTRLQDVQLAVDAILAPLDVHRPAVVLLDDAGLAGEGFDFGVGQREAVALLWRDVGDFAGLADRLVGRLASLFGLIGGASGWEE